MRSGEPTAGVGASRPAAPSPVPSASPSSDADRLAPIRLAPGYSPWKDPTVLTLLAISLVAAVLFVGGATFGPALAGDDDGDGVFPIVDILTGDDGSDDAALSLAANRTEVSAGERVAFTVTTVTDTPASNATVSVGGADHPVDESGRVVVRVDRAGAVTATASAPATGDATLASNEVALSVAPVAVQLGVESNRSVATAGEPIALTLVRADTGETVRGSIATTLLPDGDLLPANEVRRATGARLVVVPELAGTLHVVGAREDGGGETFQGYGGTVAVERSEVGLDLTVDSAVVVAGESVTATVRRGDTHEPVDATLSVGDRTLETGADGEARIPVDAAGTATIEATAATTPAIRFVPDEVRVEIRRRAVPLALDVEPIATTDGGRIDVAISRAGTGEPVEGTVSVAGRSVATDANGTASLWMDTAGERSIAATAPNTSAVRFVPATATVSVANATVDLSIVDSPGSVAPGASVSVTVRAANRGPEPGTDALRFLVGGARADRGSVTLAPGEESEITLAGTAPDAPGAVVVTVAGSDGRANRTIAVEP